MRWLSDVISTRMNLRFNQESNYKTIVEVPMPDLSNDNSFYARICLHCQFNYKERIVLALSIAPHIKPQVLDRFFLKNKFFDK